MRTDEMQPLSQFELFGINNSLFLLNKIGETLWWSIQKMTYKGTYVLVQNIQGLIPCIQSMPQYRDEDKCWIGCLSV